MASNCCAEHRAPWIWIMATAASIRCRSSEVSSTGRRDYLADHFEEIPLLLFVFAIDDLGGANIYPAIWSALLAARAEGVGGVMTMVLRNFEDKVNELLGVPVEEGWTMSAMLALGYPLGKWGVAANRRPVHEVSSRNRWGKPFGVEVPQPLWPHQDHTATDLAAAG
jgi:nitroreductase